MNDQSYRLVSRYEGAGEKFTLYVAAHYDGMNYSEVEWDRWKIAYASALQRLLAEEHSYTEIFVEATDPWRVQTLVNGAAGRAEWEMSEALGCDVYDEMANRATSIADGELQDAHTV